MLQALKDHLCNRRVGGVRCQNKAVTFCAEHNGVLCSVCLEKQSLLECRTCNKPLCPQCQCCDSFGH